MTPHAAYLFDMDGLLLDTERLFMVPLLSLAQREGISDAKARDFFLNLIGTNVHTTRVRLKSFLPAELDVGAFEEEWHVLYEELLLQGVPTRPHAKEVLEAFHAKGARMAVVTSTPGASARAKLKKAGIFDYFETVKAGDEVSANKPDPAPYLEAAADLGVDPKHCVAFEDSDLGATAAARAGCLTFQIPDLRPLDQPLPKLGQKIAQDLRQAARQLGMVEPALTIPA